MRDFVVWQDLTFFSREPSCVLMSFTLANSICISPLMSALNWCNSLKVCTCKPMQQTWHETCTTAWRAIWRWVTCTDWRLLYECRVQIEGFFMNYTSIRRFCSMHWLCIVVNCLTLFEIVVSGFVMLVRYCWTICVTRAHRVSRRSLLRRTEMHVNHWHDTLKRKQFSSITLMKTHCVSSLLIVSFIVSYVNIVPTVRCMGGEGESRLFRRIRYLLRNKSNRFSCGMSHISYALTVMHIVMW